jgi:hypothetical protein
MKVSEPPMIVDILDGIDSKMKGVLVAQAKISSIQCRRITRLIIMDLVGFEPTTSAAA